MFWYCAWQGVKSCRKNGHDKVFEVGYYGYFLVGFGSFMFHTTLKYPWQLVDELNMIYTTCLMIYANLSYDRSSQFRKLLATGSIVLCAAITVYYHYLQDPTFHQNVYAAMTVWLVSRSVYQMEISLRPSWRHSLESDRARKAKQGLPVMSREEQERVNQRDLRILQDMWVLVVWGVGVFLGGFALWGLDNKYCGVLRSWRRELGLPWGVLLEFHGWWHIFTGYGTESYFDNKKPLEPTHANDTLGAYCYIVWGIHLRHILKGEHAEYDTVWPHFGNLPELVRKRQASANGGTLNGHHKVS